MTSPAQCGFPSRGITFPKVSCNHLITNSAAFPLVPSPWSLLLHPLPFLRLSSFWLLVLFQLLLSIPEAGTFPKAPPSAHHGFRCTWPELLFSVQDSVLYFFLFFFFFLSFSRAMLTAYGGSQARVELELQLPACTTVPATRDLSLVCDLHHKLTARPAP